ncbi:MAG: heavy metal-responsive transcriptional regulator [Actinobacteria bacterium]|nr:heavy metal-responsive transcriptional regulator [Actinomycetota bacterium]
MRIGELATQLNLNPRTIRFYESSGVLPEPARTSSGYRDYDGSDLERLKFVKLAQTLGLRLDEISEVLALRDRGEVPCEYVKGLIGTKAIEIERQIQELREMRKELSRLARRAEQSNDICDERFCRILEGES